MIYTKDNYNHLSNLKVLQYWCDYRNMPIHIRYNILLYSTVTNDLYFSWVNANDIRSLTADDAPELLPLIQSLILQRIYANPNNILDIDTIRIGDHVQWRSTRPRQYKFGEVKYIRNGVYDILTSDYEMIHATTSNIYLSGHTLLTRSYSILSRPMKLDNVISIFGDPTPLL